MISKYLYIFYNLIRFGAFGFAALLPLLGVMSTTYQLTLFQIFFLILVAFSFHSYAYLLNDIIDLPLDKTQPKRAHFPLVKGVVKSSHALILAILQLPICIILTIILSGNVFSYLFLNIGFLLMSIYNLFGKKTSCPPITDAAQGCSWGCLVLYGATLPIFHLTHITITITAYIIVFTLIVNGSQGGIRDLRNDTQQGVKTTAIFFGAKVNYDKLIISLNLILYTAILQILLIFMSLLPMFFNWLSYTFMQYIFTFGIVILFNLASSILLFVPIKFINQDKPLYLGRVYIGPTSTIMGMGYVITSMTLLLPLFIFSANIAMSIIVPTIYFVCGIATYLAAQYERSNKIETVKIL